MGLLFLLGFAPDELLDVGVINVEDDHLGGAARLAAALDDAGESVEAFHETQRAGGAAAAGEHGVALAQGRQVGAGARAPLEEHALGLGQVQDGLQRIATETMKQAEHWGRRVPLLIFCTEWRGLVVVPAVAARFGHADIEPDRRVEAGLLPEHQVGELVAESLRILDRLEIVALLAPVGQGVDHPVDQLGDAALAFGRTQLAVEVLAGHDVGSRLRPVGGDFHVTLLKKHLALVVADRGRAQFPLDLVVRRFPGLQPGSEIPGKSDSSPFGNGERLFQFDDFAAHTQIHQ
jgi:hypothetical protein